MPKTFFIRTFGCQMNVADSDYVTALFENNGCKKTDKLEDADVVLVNTCTVRQHAEDRALSFVGTMRHLKSKKTGMKIFVIGCAASRLKGEIKRRLPFVDGVIPAYEIEKLPYIVSAGCGLENPEFGEFSSRFIPISRGCSNYCSYCIVPYARGEEKCRQPEQILAEAEMLTSKGITDITLLGQNVNSYRCQGLNFAGLLEKLCSIEKLKALSFLTSHPKDLSDATIDIIKKCNKINRDIHLPAQSGSDRILKLMNRGYTAEYYIALIRKIKKEVPDAHLSTDIIVGFPTETDDDFNATLRLIEEAGFTKAFTFKYSPRENTKAYLMEDDIPITIKKSRLKKLNDTLQEIKCQILPH
jgi:tRNA-2-methylthio-N6-dimethylallyladenosine synthase